MGELSLGNVRDFAARNEAFNPAKLDGNNKLETTPKGILSRGLSFIFTPLRWAGRAISWLVGDSTQEQQTVRSIRNTLITAYGQDFVREEAGDVLDQAERSGGVTSRELSGILSRLDSRVAQVRRDNLVVAKRRLEERLTGLENNVSEPVRKAITQEVLALIANDPVLRTGDAEAVSAKIDTLVDGAVARRRVLQQGALPRLQTEFLSESSFSAILREGSAMEARLAEEFGDARLGGRFAGFHYHMSALMVDEVEQFLSEVPVERDEVTEFAKKGEILSEQIDEQVTGLRELVRELREKSGPPPLSEKRQAAIASLENLISDLQSVKARIQPHVNEVRAMSNEHPLSEGDIRTCLNLLDQAALNAIRDRMDKPGISPNERVALQKMKLRVENQLRERNTNPPGTRVYTSNELKQLTEALHAEHVVELGYAMEETEQLGMDLPLIGPAEHLLEKGHLEARNKFGWDIISTDVPVEFNGVKHTFKNRITPAGRGIQGTQGDVDDTIEAGYRQDGIRGTCSDDRSNHRHATNLGETQLTTSDGTLLYRGVRHGVITAKIDLSELTPEERREICDDLDLPHDCSDSVLKNAIDDARAMEVIGLALQGNDGVRQRALARGEDGEIPVLNITSINLQTGSDTFTDSDSMSLEGRMINRQEQALRRLAGRDSLEMTVVDPATGEARKVKVKLNVIPINVPVNPGATGKFGPNVGSDRAKESVKSGLQALTGSDKEGDPIGGLAGEFLRGPAPEKEKQVVRELIEQCRQIANGDELFAPNGERDLYALPARLNLLSHMIGATPIFNCKSGKDRTGQLDLETKFLVARIHTTGTVPPPGQMDDRTSRQFGVFAQRTGNLQMQRYNTGIAGYKTANQPAVLARLPERVRARYIAGSKLVKH